MKVWAWTTFLSVTNNKIFVLVRKISTNDQLNGPEAYITIMFMHDSGIGDYLHS